MEISISENSGVQILILKGKILGGPEAGAINDKIHDLIAKDEKKIVIDMQELDLMNSSGLGILIAAATTLKNNGGQMILLRVPDRIQHLLKITRLNSVFNVVGSLDEAVHYLNA